MWMGLDGKVDGEFDSVYVLILVQGELEAGQVGNGSTWFGTIRQYDVAEGRLHQTPIYL